MVGLEGEREREDKKKVISVRFESSWTPRARAALTQGLYHSHIWLSERERERERIFVGPRESNLNLERVFACETWSEGDRDSIFLWPTLNSLLICQQWEKKIRIESKVEAKIKT